MWTGSKWDVSSTIVPASLPGQVVLAWNSTNNQWQPSTTGDMLKSNNLSDVSLPAALVNLGFNIQYKWPLTNASGVLQNNGAGQLSWSPLTIAGLPASGDLTGFYPGPSITTGAVNSAKILGLEDYGLAVGKRADFVLLQAADAVEAIRLRATRLIVVRAGQVVARTPAATAVLSLPNRPPSVSWTLRR